MNCGSKIEAAIRRLHTTDWAACHETACGTQYRGCSPNCVKDAIEQLLEAINTGETPGTLANLIYERGRLAGWQEAKAMIKQALEATA
jgi:hypothetical protein